MCLATDTFCLRHNASIRSLTFPTHIPASFFDTQLQTAAAYPISQHSRLKWATSNVVHFAFTPSLLALEMTSSEGGRSKDTHPLEYGQPDSYVPSYNQSSGQHAPRNHLRMRHSRSRGGGRSHHSNRRRDGRQTPRGSIHEAYRPDYRQPFGANGVKKTPVPDNRHGNETWSPVRGFNGHEEDSDAPTKVDDASEHEFDGAHQPTHVKGAGSNHDQGLRKMVHTGNQAIGDVPLTAFDLER